MRFFSFAVLSAILIFHPPAYAQQEKSAHAPFLTRGGETSVTISAGMREADLKWHVPDVDGTPNILNERAWNDISTAELRAKARHILPVGTQKVRGGLLLEAEFTGGVATSGDGEYNSYLGNNRSLQFVRQTYSDLTGDSLGGAAAVGYQFRFFEKSPPPPPPQNRVLTAPTAWEAHERRRAQKSENVSWRHARNHLRFTPLAGYAIDRQKYEQKDAYQHLPPANPNLPPIGPFHTNADFETIWKGPFAGLEGEIKLGRHLLRLRGVYHDVDYSAKGIEHSLQDLFQQDPSYEHEGEGDGVTFNAEYALSLGDRVAFVTDASYRHREIKDGLATFYPLAGGAQETNLTEVSDTSKALHLGLRYNW